MGVGGGGGGAGGVGSRGLELRMKIRFRVWAFGHFLVSRGLHAFMWQSFFGSGVLGEFGCELFASSSFMHPVSEGSA